jgi:signal transduction histidine kinase
VLASLLPLDSDPAFRSLLNIAIRSTERIQRLTDSLLDINRLEAGQPIGNRQPTSPASLAKDAVDAIMPIAQNKDQDVLLNISSDLPPIYVDADMIKRVLTNLLENAVKFTPTKGIITIGAEVDDCSILMWVRDNGPGIPSDQRDHIFQKYTRLKPGTGPKGFGLGLAYCRLAVEAHGGKIWIGSQQDEGTQFNFSIPIADGKEQEIGDQEQP